MNTAIASAATPAISALDLLRGTSMGTQWSVQIAASPRDLHAVHALIQQALDTVVAQMSTWESDSDISRFNRNPRGWVVLPAEFYKVLKSALQIAASSDGAFDPTVGALVGLWGFGADARASFPDHDALVHARAPGDWRQLRLDDEALAAWQPGGMRLDLSAIAKGFGADLAADALKEHGIGSALVEVGGELVALGHKPDGTPWRVLAESDPQRDDSEPTVLHLADCAVATSGDRWHRHVRDGREVSHTLDPRDGKPLARPPIAVTVIAADAMQADGWATALSVLGADVGLQLAAQRGLAVRFVDNSDDDAVVIRDSAAFAGYITG